MFYILIIMPFRVAFNDYYLHYLDTAFFWDILLELIFLIDMVFNFFTPYINSDQKLVVDKKKIAYNYLNSWFFIDLICILPFYALEWGTLPTIDYSAEANLLALILHPRLLRLTKLVRLIKVYKFFNEKNKAVIINRRKLILYKFAIFFVSIFYIGHLVACLWFFLAKLQGFSPDTWVARNDVADKHIVEQYLASLYFAIVTFLTVGYGDITPYTNEEIIFVCCWMIFSGFYYSFSLSNLSNAIQDLNKDDLEMGVKETSTLQICESAKFSKELIRKIKSTFKKETTNIVSNSFEDVHSLMSELPFNLKKIVVN